MRKASCSFSFSGSSSSSIRNLAANCTNSSNSSSLEREGGNKILVPIILRMVPTVSGDGALVFHVKRVKRFTEHCIEVGNTALVLSRVTLDFLTESSSISFSKVLK
ncbi:hypothetical protein E2C01_027964 [Portunus trituberculatus]|uniref:Uncharacterized protein n=1 Tax=Portunus trituberculatus TaxID=210409 RepID=A0A5B7EJG1_PORTR|nr:hypothetical protein [Portunus trituberculatus]